jgi:hypothetical protein
MQVIKSFLQQKDLNGVTNEVNHFWILGNVYETDFGSNSPIYRSCAGFNWKAFEWWSGFIFLSIRKHPQIWKVPIVVALLDFWIEKGSVLDLLWWFIGCCFFSELSSVMCLMFNCGFPVLGELNDYQSPPATSTLF